MTGMLASVTSIAEADQVFAAGTDIIDLKDPSKGALGALSIATVKQITSMYGKKAILSATVGDLPMEPGIIAPAVHTMAATGVDYVKVGWFDSPWQHQQDCLQALQPLCQQGIRIIIVQFADQAPAPEGLLDAIAAAGCAGTMLDTASKRQGSLRQCLTQSQLSLFVRRAKALRLITGLAGSLRDQDIPALLALAPDYLGFRGALCSRHQRTGGIDPLALQRIRNLVSQPSIAANTPLVGHWLFKPP